MDTRPHAAPALDRLDAAINIIELFMQKYRALEHARLACTDAEDSRASRALLEFAAAQYVTAREELATLILGGVSE